MLTKKVLSIFLIFIILISVTFSVFAEDATSGSGSPSSSSVLQISKFLLLISE
ncbi:MAG TPA: hypothetical protein VF941_23015 [Clostridia bacterium]